MKTEEIKQLFELFESAASQIGGVECWSARELQTLLGYSKWENFEKVIQKAKDACTNAGEDILNHFPDVRKTIPMPKGAEKEINDIILLKTVTVGKPKSPLLKTILPFKPEYLKLLNNDCWNMKE